MNILSQKPRILLALSAIAAFAIALVLIAPSADAGDPNNGATVYKSTCLACHGQTGKGDGPAAASLNPKPRDFTDASIMSKLSDAQIADTIRKGGQGMGKSPLMPPFPQLKPVQVDDLVTYIRTLCKCKHGK